MKPRCPDKRGSTVLCVCAFFTNFQPALVPLPSHVSEKEVEEYFQQLSDCDSDPDFNDDSDIDLPTD